MIETSELVKYIDGLLSVSDFQDYCHNGLQVQGTSNVSHIVSGVSANQEFIDGAANLNADLVLVHHGLFWKGEPLQVTGPKRSRLKSLLTGNINLLAYHLPLDAHPTLGNNASLGKLLQVSNIESHESGGQRDMLWIGQITETSGGQLSKTIEQALNRKPTHINSSSTKKINKIAWCTGAAQDYIENAYALGVDAFISGEISERTVHLAKELGIDYYAAGHYATEKQGVINLGEHLATKFKLQHTFLDIPNPI